MAGFLRRFTFDPGTEVIREIEGVVIIDREPPGSIQGLSSGTVIAVGEYEDGPFNTPTELTSGGDLAAQFGEFGYTYDGIASQNPCARQRFADAAIVPEFWNGNGFISLASKRFARLIVTRVDTSVGAIQFTRRACVTGFQAFTYALSTGEVLSLDIDGGGVADATFTGVAAITTSGAGTFPTTFVGGEVMNITVDLGTANQVGPIDVVFLSTDTTQALAIDRINATLGYTAAVDAGADVTTMTGRVAGTDGAVTINSLDALVTTALGFVVGTDAGTGNVGDISQVTFAEIKSISEAAIAGMTMSQTPSGLLRACSDSTTNPGASIEVGPLTTTTALGFVVGDVNLITDGEAGTIPAGTRVTDTPSTQSWVTMQAITIVAGNPGPYSSPIRPANDDGTGTASGAGEIDLMTAAIEQDGFTVINLLPVSDALLEPAIDALYAAAIDATLNSNAISREGNIIFSARQSNSIRTGLRTNALNASSEGLAGRISVIRPPLGTTTRAIALSNVSQPGVGAYRNERDIYAFPGANINIPQIALRGLAGGIGFTADGNIDVGMDAWLSSLMSQLPPERNPGQNTSFMTPILSVEVNNPDVQDLRIGDYTSFRKAGIAALRITNGVPVIQSGVTSVNSTLSPALVNINRRRFGDFVEDSVGTRLLKFNKLLNTRTQRAAILAEIEGFMEGLKSPGNEASQRLDDYNVDGITGNTPSQLAQGVFRIILKVRTLSTLDFIVLEAIIGENVEITVNVLDEAA